MDYLVEEARYVRDYVVWLRFRDGTTGEVDLGPELRGPVFEPLRDVECFRKVTVHPESRTLVWPNDADIAPEFLHDAARRNPAPPPATHDPGTSPDGLVASSAEGSSTLWRMPVISRFLGIAISMYHWEHGLPHFHAVYGEHRMSVEVESGVVRGTFPPRALRHVREWTAKHREELMANWERGRRQEPLVPIAPLE